MVMVSCFPPLKRYFVLDNANWRPFPIAHLDDLGIRERVERIFQDRLFPRMGQQPGCVVIGVDSPVMLLPEFGSVVGVAGKSANTPIAQLNRIGGVWQRPMSSGQRLFL